jgi:uncharacterized protein DUF4255
MFDDLDSSVAELLKRELPPEITSQVSISFATPDSQFPPTWVTLPTINLFLYEIQENLELRSAEPQLERLTNGSVTRIAPPLRADCHYLVTAWAKAGAQRPEQDEHRLLGEALRVLHRHRELPLEALQGTLKTQPFPLRATVLQAGPSQAHTDFWQALGGKPRAAFNYTVTLGIDAYGPEDIGRVTQRITRT